MKVYVAWHEGYMSSGWVSCAGTNLDAVKKQDAKESTCEADEIQIYDSDTAEHLGYIDRSGKETIFEKKVLTTVDRNCSP